MTSARRTKTLSRSLETFWELPLEVGNTGLALENLSTHNMLAGADTASVLCCSNNLF